MEPVGAFTGRWDKLADDFYAWGILTGAPPQSHGILLTRTRALLAIRLGRDAYYQLLDRGSIDEPVDTEYYVIGVRNAPAEEFPHRVFVGTYGIEDDLQRALSDWSDHYAARRTAQGVPRNEPPDSVHEAIINAKTYTGWMQDAFQRGAHEEARDVLERARGSTLPTMHLLLESLYFRMAEGRRFDADRIDEVAYHAHTQDFERARRLLDS